MTKSLIIYNLGLVQPEQLDKTLKLANLQDNTQFNEDKLNKPEVNKFISLVKDYNNELDPDRKIKLRIEIENSIRGKNRDLDSSLEENEVNSVINVRNYIQEKVKEHSDISLILHSSRSDACGTKETDFVKNSIKSAIQTLKNPLDLLYIGGGHGGWNQAYKFPGLVSGLSENTINEITELLQDKNSKSIILGSCFSANYVEPFQKMLTTDGVMLSSTVSQSSNNYYLDSIDLLTGQKQAENFLDATPLSDIDKADILIDDIQTMLDVSLNGRPSAIEMEDLKVKLNQKDSLDGNPIIEKIKKNLSSTSMKIFDEHEIDELAIKVKDFCEKNNQNPDPFYSSDELKNFLEQNEGNHLTKYLPVLIYMESIMIVDPDSYSGNEMLDNIKNDLDINQMKTWENHRVAYPKTILKSEVHEVDNKVSDDINSVLIKVQATLNGHEITGQCISTPTASIALKLDEKLTGKPISAGSDEYTMNNQVINKLGNPSYSLETCNKITQATLFNKLLEHVMTKKADDIFEIPEDFEPSIIDNDINPIDKSEIFKDFKNKSKAQKSSTEAEQDVEQQTIRVK